MMMAGDCFCRKHVQQQQRLLWGVAMAAAARPALSRDLWIIVPSFQVYCIAVVNGWMLMDIHVHRDLCSCEYCLIYLSSPHR